MASLGMHWGRPTAPWLRRRPDPNEILIRWKRGAVPKDTSKNGKAALVQTWMDLAVPEEAIRAESASAEASHSGFCTDAEEEAEAARS